MHHVFLDPDGTLGDWTFVIVAAPTGVRYRQQCAGVACEERELEGYLVPVGGVKLDSENGRIEATNLTAIFHRGGACVFGSASGRLPADRLQELRRLVAAVPWWTTGESTEPDLRGYLEIDESRLAELTEAWVPVTTTAGCGVLVWSNCD